MKKFTYFLFLLLSISLCAQAQISDSDYELSDGGKTLKKWHGENVIIDMTQVPELNAITKIAEDAFMAKGKLQEVKLPEGLQTVGKFAFGGCTSLEKINIPNSLESINFTQFRSSPKLIFSISDAHTKFKVINKVVFGKVPAAILFYPPGKVETSYDLDKINTNLNIIGASAFFECKSLQEIILPKWLDAIEGAPFAYCENLKSIEIPWLVKKIHHTAMQFSSIEEIKVAEANNTFSAVDGVLFSKDGEKLISYPPGKADAAYTTPSTVLSVEDNAFATCTKLQELTLSHGLTSIGNAAFFSCKSLKSVVLPASLKTIGSSVFSQNNALQSIDIMAIIPPSVGELDYSSSPLYTNTILRVPIQSLAKYKESDVWNRFTKIEGKDFPNTNPEVPSTVFSPNVLEQTCYFNSASNLLFVDAKELSTVELFDGTGKLRFTFSNVIGATELSLSDLSTGVYFVQIRNNAKRNVYKIVKR